MSILKSTNSGIYQQISEEFLIKNGWKKEIIADMEQFGGITVIMRFTYTPTISNNKKRKTIIYNNSTIQILESLYIWEYKHININFLYRNYKRH